MKKEKAKALTAILAICFTFSTLASSKSFAAEVISQPESAGKLYGPPEPTKLKREEGIDPHKGAKIFDPSDDFHDELKILNKKRKRLDEMEVVFQLLNIGDAVTTIDLVNRPNMREGNPLLGSHPSKGKVIAVKTLTGALHFLAYRHFRSKDTGGGFRFEAISIGVQGAITAANLRFYF